MADNDHAAEDFESGLPLFKASKKRKPHQRQRREESGSPNNRNEAGAVTIAPTGRIVEADDDERISIATRKAILRRRAVGGIEFSGHASSSRSTAESEASKHAGNPAIRASEQDDILALSTRFTPSTGTVQRARDEEKYLSAYIDSQLSKQSDVFEDPSGRIDSDIQNLGTTVPTRTVPVSKTPALVGKLQEIDLGESSRRRNEKATLRASRALDPERGSHHAADDDESSDEATRKKHKLPPKVRVTKYGRVLPPRRSRRRERDEKDVERDRAVEEMLRNSEDAAASAVSGTNNSVRLTASEREGDEELVERFKREFAENSIRHGPRAVKKDDGKASGPKLGGGRKARAMQLQKAAAAAATARK